MKKIISILTISVFLVSCKKEIASKNTVENNTNSAKADSVVAKKNLSLETFNFPEEVQGCSCYFAKDKADFEKEKYIYVDDYGNNATIKLDGKLIKFPMQEGDFDPSNFNKTLENGNYKLKMSGKKIKDVDETIMFEGEITIEKKDGEKATSTIYGECGC